MRGRKIIDAAAARGSPFCWLHSPWFGEVVDAAAGDDHKNPEAVAEAKAKITEEAEKARRCVESTSRRWRGAPEI